MRAFSITQSGEPRLVEKPAPENPGPNDAIIKTTVALLCTSDIHGVERRAGLEREITLGHEAVGLVYKLGSEVKGLQDGDRAAVGASTPCYKCINCLRGETSHCKRMLGGVKFGNIKNGVLAEYFYVENAEANVARIPDSVPDEAAVYASDMMSTGFMGAENARIPTGGVVAIFGQGPVGLMATAAARLLGAGFIIAVENITKRKDLARHFGADAVVDFTEDNPVDEIMRLTDQEGVDSTIEAVGSQGSFENCIKVTRPGGTISVIGYFTEGEYVGIPRYEWGFGMGNKSIRTGLCPGGKERMIRMLRLIENGRIDPTALTTHALEFDFVEKAFNMMSRKESGIIKPLINFRSR
jgi:threonine dehydrogenase-like Zn-dependent dehydrogenase